MADDVDRANDQAQQILDLQLRARKPKALHAIGTCHSCYELLPKVGQLFCNSDCAHDHEKEALLRGRNGKPT